MTYYHYHLFGTASSKEGVLKTKDETVIKVKVIESNQVRYYKKS